MCKNCGCGHAAHPHEHDHVHDGEDASGVHFHTDADGKTYAHRHTHVVRLESPVLEANDLQAGENRRWLRQHGVVALNLISSPGSGKTLLLEKTLVALKTAGISVAVIVGDQYGEADAERMRGLGAPVTQIQTRDSCHLTAAQIHDVLPDAVPDGTRLLLIENVGNLVCPVAFDLGEDRKIALLSTPEGEEKPLKYPGLFAAASAVLLTKMDLAEVLEWNRDLCVENLHRINPEISIFELSAKTGNGLGAWIDALKHFTNHQQI